MAVEHLQDAATITHEHGRKLWQEVSLSKKIKNWSKISSFFTDLPITGLPKIKVKNFGKKQQFFNFFLKVDKKI
jgi:hypothetical protein